MASVSQCPSGRGLHPQGPLSANSNSQIADLPHFVCWSSLRFALVLSLFLSLFKPILTKEILCRQQAGEDVAVNSGQKRVLARCSFVWPMCVCVCECVGACVFVCVCVCVSVFVFVCPNFPIQVASHVGTISLFEPCREVAILGQFQLFLRLPCHKPCWAVSNYLWDSHWFFRPMLPHFEVSNDF